MSCWSSIFFLLRVRTFFSWSLQLINPTTTRDNSLLIFGPLPKWSMNKMRTTYPCEQTDELLITLDDLHRLLPTPLTISLIQECSSGSMSHPLPDTGTRNTLYMAWTAPNTAMSCRRIFVFLANASKRGTHSKQSFLMFIQTAKHTACWYFNVSAIPCNFVLGFSKTILCTFSYFLALQGFNSLGKKLIIIMVIDSETTTAFERSSRLNSAY